MTDEDANATPLDTDTNIVKLPVTSDPADRDLAFLDEAAMSRITHDVLEEMARKIAELRSDDYIPDEFELVGCSRGVAAAAYEHVDQDETQISVAYPGTAEIVVAHLVHPRWGDEIDVAFPASYLDGTNDYIHRETVAIRDRAAGAAVSVTGDGENTPTRHKGSDLPGGPGSIDAKPVKISVAAAAGLNTGVTR